MPTKNSPNLKVSVKVPSAAVLFMPTPLLLTVLRKSFVFFHSLDQNKSLHFVQGGRTRDFPSLGAKQAHVSPARISPKCKPQQKLPERGGEQRKFQEPAQVGACWDNMFKFPLLESAKSNSTKRDFMGMMIWKRPLTVRSMSVCFGLLRVLILGPPCT